MAVPFILIEVEEGDVFACEADEKAELDLESAARARSSVVGTEELIALLELTSGPADTYNNQYRETREDVLQQTVIGKASATVPFPLSGLPCT